MYRSCDWMGEKEVIVSGSTDLPCVHVSMNVFISNDTRPRLMFLSLSSHWNHLKMLVRAESSIRVSSGDINVGDSRNIFSFMVSLVENHFR